MSGRFPRESVLTIGPGSDSIDDLFERSGPFLAPTKVDWVRFSPEGGGRMGWSKVLRIVRPESEGGLGDQGSLGFPVPWAIRAIWAARIDRSAGHRSMTETAGADPEISTQPLPCQRLRLCWVRSVIAPRRGLWRTGKEARSTGSWWQPSGNSGAGLRARSPTTSRGLWRPRHWLPSGAGLRARSPTVARGCPMVSA